MPTKKPTSRKKVTKPTKKKVEKPVEKVESNKKDDGPVKGAAALGIVAILIGLTIGGYIASRYFDPPAQDAGVPDDLIEQLASQLADDIVNEREAVDLEERKGFVQEIAEENGEEVAETEEPKVASLMRYINGYYGIAFTFPASWVFDGDVEIIEDETRLGVISSDKVELVISAIEFSELSFKRAARKLLTTEDEVTDEVEEVVRRYAELHPDEDPLTLTPADVEYGSEDFVVDGHDALVDWYVRPVLDGEPEAVVRKFWINAGGGTMYYLRFTYPVFEPTEEVLEDPYAAMVQSIIDTFEFTNDGIGDDAADDVTDEVPEV